MQKIPYKLQKQTIDFQEKISIQISKTKKGKEMKKEMKKTLEELQLASFKTLFNIIVEILGEEYHVKLESKENQITIWKKNGFQNVVYIKDSNYSEDLAPGYIRLYIRQKNFEKSFKKDCHQKDLTTDEWFNTLKIILNYSLNKEDDYEGREIFEGLIQTL